MQNILDGNFYNPSRGNLTLEGTINELFSYMAEKPEKFYDIIVGCDSSSDEDPHFPVVIVILRKGEGGRFFLKKIKYPPSERKRFCNWKGRILEETLLSCQLAVSLKERVTKKAKSFDNSLNYQLRYIHADVGENGQTKDMIREVVGLIRGNGFEPKIKPESYVASVVADRYT